MESNKTIKYKILIALFAVFFLISSRAFALTTVYFDTANMNVQNGNVFDVNLKISSDKSINVINGTLIFDKSKLSVKAVKTDGSIFSVWQTSPVFDNNKGTITFDGGVPGGFVGNAGEVLTITFVAKNSGAAKIDFQDIFSVYLNDGLGTEINPWMQPMQLSIALSPTEKEITQTVQVLLKTDKENNHLPSIISVLLILVIIFIFIKMKPKKFKTISKKKSE